MGKKDSVPPRVHQVRSCEREMKTSDLISYIVWYATEHEMKLTTVRLVKFVYLADLYHAREHSGKTLTGFPWAFVKFGPYCSEVMMEIDDLSRAGAIFAQVMESKFSGKEFTLFTCKDRQAEHIEDRIPLEVLSPLKRAIKTYGEDTAALLDHVYFETEPMDQVRKGDLLDFSKATPLRKGQSPALKPLPKEKIAAARGHITRLVEKTRKGALNLQSDALGSRRLKDDVYHEALQYLNGQELETGLEGTARIDCE